jgi:hypothetical protein
MQSHANPSLRLNSLLTGEINREFFRICQLSAVSEADTRANSKAFGQFPCTTEQGIISAEQRMLVQEQGVFPVNSEFITGRGFRYTPEKRFSQEERAQDGRKAMTEYEAEVLAIREKTARLKALRLAKEAQAQNRTSTSRRSPPPQNQMSRRLGSAAIDNSSLNIAARIRAMLQTRLPPLGTGRHFDLECTLSPDPWPMIRKDVVKLCALRPSGPEVSPIRRLRQLAPCRLRCRTRNRFRPGHGGGHQLSPQPARCDPK